MGHVGTVAERAIPAKRVATGLAHRLLAFQQLMLASYRQLCKGCTRGDGPGIDASKNSCKSK